MFITWLKSRSLFTVITNIVAVLFICLLIVNPNIQICAENRLSTSVYIDSEIDYDIPAPTPEQLSKIAELGFVESVFGYYYTESNVSINNKNVKTKILFSDCMNAIDFTMYNDRRLISSVNNAVDNPIYIDYEFASKNSVGLGECVIFNGIQFQVAKIYETNTYYVSALFAPLVGAQKEFILSRTNSYSGAYLKVNDEANAESYLREYKPLGRLKDRSAFSTEEAYQNHYNLWNSTSYYNEITNFDQRLNQAVVKSGVNNIVGYVIFVIIITSLNILLMFRKSEVKYFKSKKNKKDSKIFYLINETVSFIFSMLVLLVMFLLSQNNSLYIPNNVINFAYLGFALTILLSLIINSIIDVVVYKKKIIN